MATPKKTKAQLRQEIKDLKSLLKYEREEYNQIMELALPKSYVCNSLDKAFADEQKRTGHSIARLQRNGYMALGFTVTQAKMISEQMKLFNSLLHVTERRIQYCDRQIEKRKEAIKGAKQ